MNNDFFNFVKKIVDEKGLNLLNDSKQVKALLMDYSEGKYKNEINLLTKTIELDFPEKIKNADDNELIKTILAEQLSEENYIKVNISNHIVSFLIFLIKGVYVKDINKIENNKIIKFKETKGSIPKGLEIDKIVKNKWVCGKCKTNNELDVDFCCNCKKEYNPPL